MKFKENIHMHIELAYLSVFKIRNIKTLGRETVKLKPNQSSSYLEEHSQGKSTRITDGNTDKE